VEAVKTSGAPVDVPVGDAPTGGDVAVAGAGAGAGAGDCGPGAGPGDFGAGPGDFGAGPGDFGAGPGDFGAGPGDRGPGEGLVVHSDPKSGHATFEKYTPRTVPTITKTQHITRAIMTPALTIVNIVGFFKDSRLLKWIYIQG